MKINNLNSVQLNPYTKQINKMQAAQTTKRADQVEISSAAKELQQTNVIEGRQEKIQSLKTKIQNGEYEVNSKEVAESILSFWNQTY